MPPKGPKKLAYRLIDPETESGGRMYDLLHELVNEHHDEIDRARIALAWCTSWKADVDGKVTIGKCKKASDLDRELAPYDFVILLSEFFWTHHDTTDAQRRALLDHELCHASVAYDEHGEPRGRRARPRDLSGAETRHRGVPRDHRASRMLQA